MPKIQIDSKKILIKCIQNFRFTFQFWRVKAEIFFIFTKLYK
jgi:hypothetical protein